MHGNERASATLSHLMSIPFVTHPHFQPHIPKTTRAPSHRRTPRFRGELRTLATTKPILEQEKDFASALAPTKPNLERGNVANQTENAETPQTKLRTTKSPPTRATPPGRTRAPGTCCVRLLQPSRTQNANTPQTKLRTTKSPYTRATTPRRNTCTRHVLRALAPRKPNSERKYSASRTWNAKPPPHARNPHQGAHVLRTCCVRLLQPSRT